MAGTGAAEAALREVRAHGDRAAELALSAAPVLLAAAEALHAGYVAALACPEWFARGRSESPGLVERSIRAEFAVVLQVSERVASREIEHARLLVEELPRTRASLGAARMRWEAGRIVCSVAATLPPRSRAEFDARAAGLAVAMTPTQLRRALAQLREELHEQPLAERHARARADRSVWITSDDDGMATLCARLPAPIAVGALTRLDRIARELRCDEDLRTLAQLRADALGDLLCHGEVAGTVPSDELSTTFAPGIRAEVRLMMSDATASRSDDAAVDLDGYGLVPADAARDLVGADATFTPVRTDPRTGVIVSVGRAHRTPPPPMRLLVRLRDRTCRFPGCTRSATAAEADHTIEWRNGGETTPSNLASLCVAHHHVRHGDRWTYVLHSDGVADWTTPTGRRITTRPSATAAALVPRLGSDHPPSPLREE